MKEIIIDYIDLIVFITICILFVPLILLFGALNRIFDFLADVSQNIDEWLTRISGNLYTKWLNFIYKEKKENDKK